MHTLMTKNLHANIIRFFLVISLLTNTFLPIRKVSSAANPVSAGHFHPATLSSNLASSPLPITSQYPVPASVSQSSLPAAYYYASGILETGFDGSPCSGYFNCVGTVSWSSPLNAIGVQDGASARLINSSHYTGGNGLRACMVVTLGQIVHLTNAVVQAFVHQPQNVTQDMGMELSVSPTPLPCESPDWVVAYPYQEVGGYQGAGWYGGIYTGDVQAVRIRVWSNGGNAFCDPREFYIDSVRVYGTSSALSNRSSMSSNQPKNGQGDPRECAVNACGDVSATAGDPIDTRTGNFDYSLVDLSLDTVAGKLSFQRSYASLAVNTTLYPTDLGPGWTHNQDVRLLFEDDTIWFKAHTLNQYRFLAQSDSSFLPYPGVLAELTHDTSTNTYLLIAADRSQYTFDNNGRLLSWRDERGFGFDYTYADGRLTRVSEPLSGRFLQFEYQNGRLAVVSDSANRQVSFGYDASGDLTEFSDVRGQVWQYAYQDHRLTTVIAPGNPPFAELIVHYDLQGRAFQQYNAANERIVHLTFNPDGSTTVLDALDRPRTDGYDDRHTNIWQSDPAGYLLNKTYDANFRPIEVRDPYNRSIEYQWSANGANLTYVRDAAGNETHLEYDPVNRLVQLTDPLNRTLTFTYAGALLQSTSLHTGSATLTTTYTYTTAADYPQPPGLLKAVSDALGRTTTYTYDSLGQLVQIQDAAQNFTHLEYDEIGRPISLTDPRGSITRLSYDPAGNLIRRVRNYDPSKTQNEDNLFNLTETFTYDALGRLQQATDPLGQTTSFTYDPAGRLIQITDPLGNSLHFAYNPAGQLIAQTDRLGQTTSYEYDSTGRLWRVRDALNRVVVTFSYNPDGTLAQESHPTAAGDYLIFYETYDALRRLLRITDNAGHTLELTYNESGQVTSLTDGLGRLTRYEYNSLGLMSAVVQNAVSGVAPDAQTNVRTQYEYDLLGNLTGITDANGHSTTFTYDVLDRLIGISDPLGNVTTFSYDPLGNLTARHDPNGNTILYSYDLANRLQAVDYPPGTADVSFEYDPLGRLAAMQDGLGRTSWSYDPLGRITGVTDPFGKTLTYGYDAEGRRTSLTYPSATGKVLTYHYDPPGRLVEVREGSTPLVQYIHDVAGRLIQRSLANGVSSHYTYDLSGQLIELQHLTQDDIYTYAYEYDAVGNLTLSEESRQSRATSTPTVTLTPSPTPTGTVTLTPTPSVTPSRTPTRTATASPNPTRTSTSTRTPTATPLPLRKVFLPLVCNLCSGTLPPPYPPPPSSGGMDAQRSSPPLDPYPAPLPESQTTPSQTSLNPWRWLQPLADFFETFLTRLQTALLPVTGKGLAVPPPASAPQTAAEVIQIVYEYDALDRLTAAQSSTGETFTYTYDPSGNRLSQTLNGVTTLYTYDAANRLLIAAGTAFTWDDNGNLLSDGLNTYTHDAANRLSALTGPAAAYTFTYDGLGNRYQTTADGSLTTFTLDNAASLPQVLAAGDALYYHGLERIARQDVAGGVAYFLTDRLGSVRLLTDAGGSVIRSQSFDPFGNLLSASGSTLTNYGFTGEWHDPTHLIYLRARYYAPQWGRFLTRDPFPGILSHPATLNPYPYALNNPLRFTDPSGENPFLLLGGFGGLLGGAAYGYGVQVIRNLNHGLCFWDALSFNIDAGQVALYAGVGTLLGTGLGAGAAGIYPLLAHLGTATTLTTTLSADGDPTNEVRTGVYTVYQVVQNGVTKYVGITNDFVRRAGEHLRTRSWVIEPLQGLEHLSRADARAVEQVLIEKYGLANLYNQINSISPNNPIYHDAISRGLEILRIIGHK
ncbi:MAG: hypothetical protein KatS3mg047_1468 [Bellilinea sp.]|nr:MAG: hypothetical protein KatS3mg047_1468 [Bellilinea sp.]